MSLVDQDARRAIEEALDRSFLVEAAAGSGKTYHLVRRLVRCIERGDPPASLVAITFTENSAEELKERITSALLEAAPRSPLAARALFSLEEAHIGTIHSFCAKILREHAIDAHVDPLFQRLSSAEAAQLRERAIAGWLTTLHAGGDDPGKGDSRDGEPLWLRRAALRLGDLSETLLTAFKRVCELRFYDAPWSTPESSPAQILVHARKIAEKALSDPPSKQTRYLRACARLARAKPPAQLSDFERAEVETDIHGLAQLEPKSQRSRSGSFSNLSRGLDQHLLAELRGALDAPLALYERLKQERGVLDHEDLLLKAERALATQPALRATLRRQIKRLFVDEFQDTDPVQHAIIEHLCAREGRFIPGMFFGVGDPQQAIYAFRGAGSRGVEESRKRMLSAGVESLRLRSTFRAVPELVDAINAAFQPPTPPPAAHDTPRAYVPLSAVRASDLRAPLFAIKGTPNKSDPIRGDLPAQIADWVHFLCRESGWTLPTRKTDPASPRRPFAPSDIALLFSQVSSSGHDRRRPYADALAARGIPLAIFEHREFRDLEEVKAIATALCAIEYPDDAIAVYATLRRLYGFVDAALIRHPLHPLHADTLLRDALRDGDPDAMKEELTAIQGALTFLKELHRVRNRQPIEATLAALIDHASFRLSAALQPSGSRRLWRLERCLELAAEADARAETFRAFADRLREPDVKDAGKPPVEGVLLSTVHGVKGMEFPVVILCDEPSWRSASSYLSVKERLNAFAIGKLVPRDLSLHQAELETESQREQERLTYVAATRATEILVITQRDDPRSRQNNDQNNNTSWVAPLHRLLAQASPPQRRPLPLGARAQTARTEPPRGTQDPPAQGPEVALARVAPRRFLARWLREPSPAQRAQVALDPAPFSPADAAESARGAARFEAFERAHDARITRGITPSRTALTMTQEAAMRAEDGSTDRQDVQVLEVATPPRSVRGPRFGTLVHAVLAALPLRAPSATPPVTIEDLAAAQGLALGCPPPEIDAAIACVQALTRHPIWARAQQAIEARREVHVWLEGADGQLLEGVVDLAILEDDPFLGQSWTVIDYKTDLLAKAPPEYLRQVALYAEAIARATGIEASGVLLAL